MCIFVGLKKILKTKQIKIKLFEIPIFYSNSPFKNRFLYLNWVLVEI